MKEAEEGYVIDGITIAPGVVETIISLAVSNVAGVAGVGSGDAIAAIKSAFNAGGAAPVHGIEVIPTGEKQVNVVITIQAFYGYRLVEVADQVRKAISDALAAQLGVTVNNVDVYVDSLSFEE